MYGKIVIAGNSIEELERELSTVKALVAMGKTYGVGGNSIAEVEDGLRMVGGTPPTNQCQCCNCDCCDEEDEDLYDEEDEYYEDDDEEEDVSEIVADIIDRVKDLEDIIKR